MPRTADVARPAARLPSQALLALLVWAAKNLFSFTALASKDAGLPGPARFHLCSLRTRSAVGNLGSHLRSISNCIRLAKRHKLNKDPHVRAAVDSLGEQLCRGAGRRGGAAPPLTPAPAVSGCALAVPVCSR